MEHKLKMQQCLITASTWIYIPVPQLAEIHLHQRFFPLTPPSADRMQFYYWNCLLMIPN